MKFELTLLGTNAALPTPGRAPSGQSLLVHHRPYLIDCGEGTQLRLIECGVRHRRIRQIFISHLHGDHVFGLIGLLTSWQLSDRRDPVDVFAPQPLEAMIRVQLEASQTQLGYPLSFHQVDSKRHYRLFEDRHVEVFSLPLDHRVPTTGYLFREKDRPNNIRPEKIEEYRIPVEKISAIKAGADFALPDGRRISHEELTVPAPPPRSFAYCSDTRFREALVPLLRKVDLLYHEATFLEEQADLADRTGHSTARQAAALAQAAEVGTLVLGHFSSRYGDVEQFAREARRLFPNSIAGKEGMRIEVPFEGRGLKDK